MSQEVSRIVVGYDYSPLADLAATRAFELASQMQNAEVHVVTVIMLGDGAGAGFAGVPVHPAVSYDSAHDALRERVERIAASWTETSGKKIERVTTHVRSEAPAHEIAQLAVDLEAVLIVVGTHGYRGFKRLLLGSVAEGVVRLAHCEVLVVRPREMEAEVPKIEPPCPRCVEERKRTGGEQMWCEQHRERHGQRHTYHYENRINQSGNVSGLYGMR